MLMFHSSSVRTHEENRAPDKTDFFPPVRTSAEKERISLRAFARWSTFSFGSQMCLKETLQQRVLAGNFINLGGEKYRRSVDKAKLLQVQKQITHSLLIMQLFQQQKSFPGEKQTWKYYNIQNTMQSDMNRSIFDWFSWRVMRIIVWLHLWMSLCLRGWFTNQQVYGSRSPSPLQTPPRTAPPHSRPLKGQSSLCKQTWLCVSVVVRILTLPALCGDLPEPDTDSSSSSSSSSPSLWLLDSSSSSSSEPEPDAGQHDGQRCTGLAMTPAFVLIWSDNESWWFRLIFSSYPGKIRPSWFSFRCRWCPGGQRVSLGPRASPLSLLQTAQRASFTKQCVNTNWRPYGGFATRGTSFLASTSDTTIAPFLLLWNIPVNLLELNLFWRIVLIYKKT